VKAVVVTLLFVLPPLERMAMVLAFVFGLSDM
jgi:hypothetical protein